MKVFLILKEKEKKKEKRKKIKFNGSSLWFTLIKLLEMGKMHVIQDRIS